MDLSCMLIIDVKLLLTHLVNWFLNRNNTITNQNQYLAKAEMKNQTVRILKKPKKPISNPLNANDLNPWKNQFQLN